MVGQEDKKRRPHFRSMVGVVVSAADASGKGGKKDPSPVATACAVCVSLLAPNGGRLQCVQGKRPLSRCRGLEAGGGGGGGVESGCGGVCGANQRASCTRTYAAVAPHLVICKSLSYCLRRYATTKVGQRARPSRRGITAPSPQLRRLPCLLLSQNTSHVMFFESANVSF